MKQLNACADSSTCMREARENFFRRDSWMIGFVSGLIYPAIFFFIFTQVNEVMVKHLVMPKPGFRLQFMCILSLLSNLLPATGYYHGKKDNSLRGIALSTFIYLVIILIYFNKGLLTDS